MKNLSKERLELLRLVLASVPSAMRECDPEWMTGLSVLQTVPEIVARYTGGKQEILSLAISFTRDGGGVESLRCSCARGLRGQICHHLVALLTLLLSPPSSPASPTLAFLDRFLGSLRLGAFPQRLAVEFTVSPLGVSPHFHLEQGDDTGHTRRRLTAADLNRLDPLDPFDTNLLTYLRSFRQILFFSQYTPFRKYPWSFWLTLAGHPRLFWNGHALNLECTSCRLQLKEVSPGQFQLDTPTLDPGMAFEFHPVEGGALLLLPAEKRAVLWQLDPVRTGILQEVLQRQIRLNYADLTREWSRLVQLERFFSLQLPPSLLEAEPHLIPKPLLLLELNSNELLLFPRMTYTTHEVALLPGEGPPFLEVEGRAVRRNFSVELEYLRALEARLPGAHLDSGPSAWRLPAEAKHLSWLKTLMREKIWALAWRKKRPRVYKAGQRASLRLRGGDGSPLSISLSLGGRTLDLTPLLSREESGWLSGFAELQPGLWLQLEEDLVDRLNRVRLALLRRKEGLFLKPMAPMLLAGLPLAVEGNPTLQEAMSQWQSPRNRPLPEGFIGSLREYQLFGYQWLVQRAESGLGAILADDMGLGKTVQALAVLAQRKALGPALVVAPASVLFNWGEECERFAPHLQVVFLGKGPKTRRKIAFSAGQLVLVSYAMLLKEGKALSSISWATLVLDEAQFAKNAWSKTARALAQIPRSWTLALTGTPLENHLGELWSLFKLAQPDVLGDWSHFRRRFLDPMRTWSSERQMETLRSLIRPFLLRREKEQVELPARQDVVMKVVMEQAQRRLYEEERSRILQQLDEGGGQLGFRVLAGLTRLRQLACHPRLLDPRYRGDSAKLQIFRDLVSGLVAHEHHLLVFSQFTEFLDLLARELDRMGIAFIMMTGQTPVPQRAALITRFQQGTVPIFLVSLRAGGTGLNLTRANYVFLMDPWWNPAVEEQATDRAHRLGQTRSVTVYRFIVEDTIEESVCQLHEAKRQLLECAVGDLAPLAGDPLQEWIRLLQGSSQQ